ncbi:MAG: hypothetical protein R6V53_07040, partial [Candidatus Woesearchaeota archaeon]
IIVCSILLNTILAIRWSKSPRIQGISLVLIVVFAFSALTFSPQNRFDCHDNWAYLNLGQEYIFGYQYENQTFLEERETMSTLNRSFQDFYRFEKNNHNILENYKKDFLNDESFATGIHLSFFIALFGEYTLLYALIMALTSAILYVMVKNITQRVYAIATVILLNASFLVSIPPILDRNLFGMFLITFITFLLFYERTWTIAGLTYGVLGTIQPLSLLFAPAMVIYLMKPKRLLMFGAASLLAITPFLIIKGILYGNPLFFEGFIHMPSFQHSFLGIDFGIKTTLNYPFHTQIVKTQGFPYPMFIYLPLTLISVFGWILTPSFFFGTKTLGKKALYLWISILVFLGFLMINENWENMKTAFLLLIFPHLLILCMNGLKKVVLNPNYFLRYILILIAIAGIAFGAQELEFPSDKRIMNDEKGEKIEIGLLPAIKLPDKETPKEELPIDTSRFNCSMEGESFSDYRIEDGYLILQDKVTNKTGDIQTLSTGRYKGITISSGCYSFDLIVEKDRNLTLNISNISRKKTDRTIARQIRIPDVENVIIHDTHTLVLATR